MLFHIIEGAQCVTHSNGTYTQKALYNRGGELYAGNGSTFILLKDNGNTSKPNTRWDHIEGVKFHPCKLGRLQVK